MCFSSFQVLLCLLFFAVYYFFDGFSFNYCLAAGYAGYAGAARCQTGHWQSVQLVTVIR